MYFELECLIISVARYTHYNGISPRLLVNSCTKHW